MANAWPSSICSWISNRFDKASNTCYKCVRYLANDLPTLCLLNPFGEDSVCHRNTVTDLHHGRSHRSCRHAIQPTNPHCKSPHPLHPAGRGEGDKPAPPAAAVRRRAGTRNRAGFTGYQRWRRWWWWRWRWRRRRRRWWWWWRTYTCHRQAIFKLTSKPAGQQRLLVLAERGGWAKGKGQATLCVQSAQYRTRSSDIALLRSLKQCSADREYTY